MFFGSKSCCSHLSFFSDMFCERAFCFIILLLLGCFTLTSLTFAEVTGNIQLEPYNRAFREHFTSFQIIATNGEGEEFQTTPDNRGRFTFSEIQPGPDVELTWNRGEISEYIIWPLKHVGQSQSPYNFFAFKKFTDVHTQEKNRILRSIKRGDLEEAHTLFENVEEIYEFFDDPDNPELYYTYREKKYVLLRDMCDKAARYRAEVGRSEITEEMIATERKWLRKMILTATDNATANSMPSIIVGLSLWSAFSAGAYSQQRNWPSRPISSIDETQPSFFRNDTYQLWMEEDLLLIKDVFDTDHVENIIEQFLEKSNLAILEERERIAIEEYQDLLALDPEEMSLIKLANFISGLNRLRRELRDEVASL